MALLHCYLSRVLCLKRPQLMGIVNNVFPSAFLSQAFHQTVSWPPHSQCPPSSAPFKFHFDDPQDPPPPQFLELLKKVANVSSQAEAATHLDHSGFEANRDLICSAIWALREEWKPAFVAFKWGGKWHYFNEKVCNLMIWVLGTHGKFSTAWCIIRDMYRSSLSTRWAMLIMIDR